MSSLFNRIMISSPFRLYRKAGLKKMVPGRRNKNKGREEQYLVGLGEMMDTELVEKAPIKI